MPNRVTTIAVSALLSLIAAACSSGGPGSSTASPRAAPTGGTQPSGIPPTAAQASAAPTPTASPTGDPATPVPSAGAQVITTFTVLMDDGPKEGAWEVTYSGEVAGCRYLPDLDRWLATWLGPPPLSFIDANGDATDGYFLVTFDGDAPTAVRIRPLGDVSFEVDDRGDTATLAFVSEENEADFDDGSPSETFGPIELTIECGSIFRG